MRTVAATFNALFHAGLRQVKATMQCNLISFVSSQVGLQN
jgi:hypothetical protein